MSITAPEDIRQFYLLIMNKFEFKRSKTILTGTLWALLYIRCSEARLNKYYIFIEIRTNADE